MCGDIPCGKRSDERRKRTTAALIMLQQVARGVHAAHEAGIDQDDLAPNNFLLTPDGGLQMIDFERARLGSQVAADARARALAKLDRELAGASLADRGRFLRGYCRGERAEWRRLWRRRSDPAT